MFNSKEKKSLAFLVGGLVLLEVGSSYISSYYLTIGMTTGAIGILLFGYGAYLSIETMTKSIREIKQNILKLIKK